MILIQNDGFDNLLSETTPQGTVNYTYDADKRKQTMIPSGQAQITYTYDNAGRLTSIVQGASTVSFGYDSNGRRTSMTLPNGVVATLSYDAASQLTQMVYQGGFSRHAESDLHLRSCWTARRRERQPGQYAVPSGGLRNVV